MSSLVFTLPAADLATRAPLTLPLLKLYVRARGRQYFPLTNLVCLQSEANYSWLCWANGQRLLMPRTLKWYMAQLPATHFIRFHRSCIVNRCYIKHVEHLKGGGLLVHLTTGQALPISRRRWSSIRRQLRTYRLEVRCAGQSPEQ